MRFQYTGLRRFSDIPPSDDIEVDKAAARESFMHPFVMRTIARTGIADFVGPIRVAPL